MIKKRKIKGNHILIIGAGLNTKKYKNKIFKFIKKNNPVTFACNYINNIIIPDYHLWNSAKRWNVFADSIDKNSILVLNSKSVEKFITKKMDRPYKTFKCIERRWKKGGYGIKSKRHNRCRVYYKNGKMFGCFRDAVILAIFYSYIKKASKISVVGMDGYTFYSRGGNDGKNINAHCFKDNLETGMKIKQKGERYYKDLDVENNATLALLHKYALKKYGLGFEILTPTVHDQFYNSDILM
jgi:hypothetical protein